MGKGLVETLTNTATGSPSIALVLVLVLVLSPSLDPISSPPSLLAMAVILTSRARTQARDKG